MESSLQKYIRQARAAGMTDKQIEEALLRAGWNHAQINFNVAEDTAGQNHDTGNPVPPPPPNSAQPIGNEKGMAIICYLSILWLIPLLMESKNHPFVKFHIKQGIVLTIATIAVWILAGVIGFTPVIGSFVLLILKIFLVFFVIIGIINASQGKEKELPVIGSFANNFHF